MKKERSIIFIFSSKTERSINFVCLTRSIISYTSSLQKKKKLFHTHLSKSFIQIKWIMDAVKTNGLRRRKMVCLTKLYMTRKIFIFLPI